MAVSFQANMTVGTDNMMLSYLSITTPRVEYLASTWRRQVDGLKHLWRYDSSNEAACLRVTNDNNIAAKATRSSLVDTCWAKETHVFDRVFIDP